MRRRVGILGNATALIAAAALTTTTCFAQDDAADRPEPRIEARSATLLAVGIVHGDRMSIHLSRLRDNAPVRDAVMTVLLRGVLHPTTAQADGGYTLQSKDLDLPGSASMVFQIAEGDVRQDLEGTLQIPPDTQPKPAEKNSARQLWWWVLNFAVCIGFLMLISRRRKAAAKD